MAELGARAREVLARLDAYLGSERSKCETLYEGHPSVLIAEARDTLSIFAEQATAPEGVQAAARGAFKAGWRTNAVGEDAHSREYLDGCEDVDWEEYQRVGLLQYLASLVRECEVPGCENQTSRGICSDCDLWVSKEAAALAAPSAQPAGSATSAGEGPSDALKVQRLARFMGEQEEREAVVDWLRKVGDSKPHGTDWRAYYAAADAIETEQHRRSAPAAFDGGKDG